MNIEEELKALASETKTIPEKLSMENIIKNTKKRQKKHTIALTAKAVLTSAAVLFATLLIGVNASVSFAKTATDLPILGKLSSALIVRKDIKDALGNNIKESIEAGDFTEVNELVKGEKGLIDCNVKSYISDHLSFVLLMDMETSLDFEAQKYYLGNFRFSKLRLTDDPNEFTYSRQIQDSNVVYQLGKESYIQIYDMFEEKNFAFEFDVFDCEPKLYDMDVNSEKNTANLEYNQAHCVDSIRIEFRDVSRKPSKYFRLDKPFTYEKQELKVREMMLYNTGTKIFVEYSEIPGLDFDYYNIYLTDENGEVIADPFSEKSFYSRMYYELAPTLDDELLWTNSYACFILPSIYHKDVDKIQIHIKSITGNTYDTNMLKIDPETNTAYFKDKSYPVKKYDSSYTYESFGLDQAMPMTRLDYCIYAVPKDPDMPAFNTPYNQSWRSFSYSIDEDMLDDIEYDEFSKRQFSPYPTVSIDGQEYILVFCELEDESDPFYTDAEKELLGVDGFYYFAELHHDQVTYDINQKIDVDT